MYKYSNFPKTRSEEEYKKQEALFISFLSELPSIISLYSIGEMELLGVSDLDYLIVYQGEDQRIHIQNEAKKYDLIDTVLFLERSNISQIHYISHHIQYKLVFGEDLNIYSYDFHKRLLIIYSWKICFFSLLRNYYFFKYSKNISIKALLSHIYDIRYPIFFLKDLGIHKPIYDDFLNTFCKYRKEYFHHQDYKKLEGFLEQAIDLSWDIVYELSEYLKSDQNTGRTYIYGRFPTIFSLFSTFSEYRKNTEKRLNYIGFFSRFLFLPPGFDFRFWNKDFQDDLKIILKNNPRFLNFSLPSFSGKILLCIKKLGDVLLLRIF